MRLKWMRKTLLLISVMLLSGLMDKLPGMGQVPESVKQHVTGMEVPRMIAIIYSMTPEERQMPKLINCSRLRRIADCSGTAVQEVNRLLKDFEQMRKMMKNMMKGGKKGRRGMPMMPGF